MMNRYGMDGGGWIWMVLVWAGLLGVIAFAITRLVGSGGRSGAGAPDARAELTPQEILDRRLASGEIDPDTYGAISDRLAGNGRRGPRCAAGWDTSRSSQVHWLR